MFGEKVGLLVPDNEIREEAPNRAPVASLQFLVSRFANRVANLRTLLERGNCMID